MTTTKNITIPAGTTIRTKDRTGNAVETQTATATAIPFNKAVLSLTPNTGRILVSFQYKGRRATCKLSKGLNTR